MQKLLSMKTPFIIERDAIIDYRGNLCFWENASYLPFEIARTYWIYDVPSGQFRGSHALKEQEEVIIALSGSFTVELENENFNDKFTLNRSNIGLYIPSMTWRSLHNFSTNSICLVLSSKSFSEDDYIRSYNEFKKLIYIENI